jgi:hypothetical protein
MATLATARRPISRQSSTTRTDLAKRQVTAVYPAILAVDSGRPAKSTFAVAAISSSGSPGIATMSAFLPRHYRAQIIALQDCRRNARARL